IIKTAQIDRFRQAINICIAITAGTKGHTVTYFQQLPRTHIESARHSKAGNTAESAMYSRTDITILRLGRPGTSQTNIRGSQLNAGILCRYISQAKGTSVQMQ